MSGQERKNVLKMKRRSKQQTFCEERVNSYPFYSPRFWAGMRFTDYMGLLSRNHFRVHPTRIPMMFMVGGCSVLSSGLALTQQLLMKRQIEATELSEPPIFIIGHWRSGTTLLHEMLCLDQQFSWPSTFECFVPTYHNLTKPFLQPLLRLLMPSKRPMDSMPAGPNLPQEDEFALVGMGAPTPYYHIAFSNERPEFQQMLNLNDANAGEIEELRNSLTWFYKSISYKNPKRLVLKSPTHTGRIAHLAKWFPGAKFVHITRHPHKIFPSSIHLWKSLAAVQGYQCSKDDEQRLIDQVNQWYREMYDGYFDQVEQIPKENLVQLRFEDLVKDPVNQIESIYSAFDLQGFAQARVTLENYWSQRKSHRANKTQLNEATKELIDDVWSDYITNFGYASTEKDASFVRAG